MTTPDDSFVASFADAVAALPGVVAVSLGGSRARGEARPDSDWDFALYYRGRFDPDDVRATGWPGEVSDLGGWGGGVMNGGAWLELDGRRVDLHYRDLDDVERRCEEAERGEFGKQLLMFHLAGVPTYLPVAELALNRVLRGRLPRPDYPAALRRTAAHRWHADAVLSLSYATHSADPVVQIGNLARAAIEEAHSRLAARGIWVTNEKGITRRAGLSWQPTDGAAALAAELDEEAEVP